jgi:hypothetical protein
MHVMHACMQASQVQFAASRSSFEGRYHVITPVQIVMYAPAGQHTPVLLLKWCAACDACAIAAFIRFALYAT